MSISREDSLTKQPSFEETSALVATQVPTPEPTKMVGSGAHPDKVLDALSAEPLVKNAVSFSTRESKLDKADAMKGSDESNGSWVTFVTFLLAGTVQLYGFNSLISVLPAIYGLDGESDKSSTVLACYSSVLALLTLVAIRYNFGKPIVLYCGLGLGGVMAVVLPLLAQFTGSATSALLHLYGGMTGVVSFLIGSGGFGIAAQFPSDYSGAMSAGLGVSGVLTFVMWGIAKIAIFRQDSKKDVVGATAIVCSVYLLCAVISFTSMQMLFRRESIRSIFEKKSTDVETGSDVAAEGTYEKEGVMGVVRAVWFRSMLFAIMFCTTLFVFPNLLPFGMGFKEDWENLFVVGTYQVGDLIGRYMPNVIAMLLIKYSVATWIILGRLAFIVIAVLSYICKSTAVIGDLWWCIIQVFGLAITNGWLCTVSFVRILERVDGNAAKTRAASFALLASFLGLTAGSWIAVGFKALV